ncbi:MAG: SIMPL domain-containing protein [Patescibacteria group bacterium]
MCQNCSNHNQSGEVDQAKSCCEPSWHNPKTIMRLVGYVLLATIVIVAILRDRIVNQPQWQVSVTGQGKVAYQPDIAVVTLGVDLTKQFSAESALKQLNDRMSQIVKAVKAAGIPADDIQTQNYNLNPQYDFKDGVSIAVGYSASQQLIVKVRKLKDNSEAVSKVIAEATKAGANQVAGIAFEVDNLSDLKQEARLKAVADAKSRAEALAEATDVDLGEVVGWWENIIQAPGNPPIGIYDGKGGAGMGAGSIPTLPTGTSEVIMEINLNYKLK